MFAQAAVLRQTDKIGKPVADEGRDGEQKRQHPPTCGDGDDQHRPVESEQNARPPDRLAMLLGLVGMQRRQPFVDWRPLIGRDAPNRSQRRDDQGRDESAFAKGPPALRQQVDSEHLQHEGRSERRLQRQQILAVALRVQRVSMVVGVAAGIIEGVPPADQTEEI